MRDLRMDKAQLNRTDDYQSWRINVAVAAGVVVAVLGVC